MIPDMAIMSSLRLALVLSCIVQWRFGPSLHSIFLPFRT